MQSENNRLLRRLMLAIVPLSVVLWSFSFTGHIEDLPKRDFKTKYVIVLVIDGPRLTETFGDSTHQYIPFQSGELMKEGVLVQRFRNNGSTFTNAGHTAITTGVYQRINNSGLELPNNPSYFQFFLKEKGYDSTKAWVIASKGKLDILTNTKSNNWKNLNRPSAYCGVGGKGLGYAEDQNTWSAAKSILTKHHPYLALINVLEVDVQGHASNWEGYLEGIRKTDKIAYELWDFIQHDSIYKDKTALFITNDHGRHKKGHKSGFINHGDCCEGCRSIYLLALGPDFKNNKRIDDRYEQIDISKTIAVIMGFQDPISKGEFMVNLFD